MPPTLSNLTGPLSDINKALYGDMPQLERPMTELERLRKRQEGETPRTTELGDACKSKDIKPLRLLWRTK